MKRISIRVSDPVAEDFRFFDQWTGSSQTDLAREAIELYRQQHMQFRTSLRDRQPASVGGPIRAVMGDDD